MNNKPNPVKISRINPSAKWWDTNKTKLILKLETPYVRNYCLSMFSDTLKDDSGVFVQGEFHYNPKFKCELCGSGNAKQGRRPASFYPTEVGYIYSCAVCNPSLPLNQFFQQTNPSIAKKHQEERWHKKLTGKSYNCPEPPKEWKKEFYKRKEAEIKEKNKKAYIERNKSS
tara:strand:- start:116 stop:628 length:513 start_codon:yes stop_codon:yes gene_type:complete